MAAEPVLGVSKMWPPLLDDVPHATRRGTRRSSGTAGTCGTIGTCQASDPVTSRAGIP